MNAAERLAQAIGPYETRPDGYYVACPCHDDQNPSLCIAEKGGKVVWVDRAGCAQAAVTAALKPYRDQIGDNGGPSAKPRIVAEYPYHDEDYKELFQVVRYSPKAFRQRRRDSTAKGGWVWSLGKVRRVLYRLPDILPEHAVVVVEGEKDALALAALGIQATCNAGGAGKWRREYSESLRDKRVAIIADRDAPGRKHAQKVAEALFGISENVRVLESPYPHKDVADWVEKGKGTRADIISAIKATPEWTPADPSPPAAIIHHIDHEQGAQGLQDPREWPHGLKMGKNGPLALSLNVSYALKAHPSLAGIVSLDTFTNRVVLRRDATWGTKAGEKWSDEDDTELAEYLQAQDIKAGPDMVDKAVRKTAKHNQFHSLQDYLCSLKWDGHPRVAGVSGMLGARTDLAAELVKLWLVSAVARAMIPGCQADHVLVLEGAQGIRKSTALRVLFDPLGKGWFRDDLPPLNTKDAQQFLEGTWCVEISELSAVNSRRAELEHVKAFISRRVDSYRPSYGRKTKDFPRGCVFAGSTNDISYLKDTTGNRRWWMISCQGRIDIDRLAKEAPQIWAEAVHMFDMGAEWWVDINAQANADLMEEQEMRRYVDPWEAEIIEYLKGRSYCTMGDVLAHLKVPLERRTQADANRAQRIITMRGWTRKKLYINGKSFWAYVKDINITGQIIERDSLI